MIANPTMTSSTGHPSGTSRSLIFAWLADTFRGVTWPRVGLFCFFSAWMSLGSGPAAHAVLAQDPVLFLRELLTFALGIGIVYGLPTLGLVAVTNRWLPGSWQSRVGIAATVLTGSFVYAWTVALAFYVPRQTPVTFGRIAGLMIESGVEIGVIGAVIVLLAQRDRASSALQQEQVDRIAVDREIAEARVLTLQSQIEPHFLFNTLANVRFLLATDRHAGRLMVRQLSRYLQSALPQLRETRSSLGRELALTTAYLNLQQVRMGDRLAVSVDVPGRLAAATFPPMMLMTLVENAIKHGLAPLPGGGSVAIAAFDDGEKLVVRVADTGAGIKSTSGIGIGIANTRARLLAMFGSRGKLRIHGNDTGGVTAEIELPLHLERWA